MRHGHCSTSALDISIHPSIARCRHATVSGYVYVVLGWRYGVDVSHLKSAILSLISPQLCVRAIRWRRHYTLLLAAFAPANQSPIIIMLKSCQGPRTAAHIAMRAGGVPKYEGMWRNIAGDH